MRRSGRSARLDHAQPAGDERPADGDEVHEWLRRFGFRERVVLEPTGFGGFSLLLAADGDARTSFIDTGFGMSQVLPLIVQGVTAAPRKWIITEQPEIHLNPRLQAELPDLFISWVRDGSGVLVETHSEHFLLRLRRLVAAGEIDAAQVALYFVEREDGASQVREIPIEESGRIDPSSWPHGFFEDSLREALTLAQLQAKHRPGERDA